MDRLEHYEEIEKPIEADMVDALPDDGPLPTTGANQRKKRMVYVIPIKDYMPVPKIGRNEKCKCGSGLKWKHCCGLKRDMSYQEKFLNLSN